MPNLYRTSRDSKTVEIEDTDREGFPFRLVITLRKLGVITMLDFFLSPDDAEGVAKTLHNLGVRHQNRS
jgi:hypothetical protein